MRRKKLSDILLSSCPMMKHFPAMWNLCVARLNKKSNWILRIFQSRNPWFIKFMWKTLVQCHIDYCYQLYIPGKPADLERLENLQRLYTNKPGLLAIERRMERYTLWTYILYTTHLYFCFCVCGATVITAIVNIGRSDCPTVDNKQLKIFKFCF